METTGTDAIGYHPGCQIVISRGADEHRSRLWVSLNVVQMLWRQITKDAQQCVPGGPDDAIGISEPVTTVRD